MKHTHEGITGSSATSDDTPGAGRHRGAASWRTCARHSFAMSDNKKETTLNGKLKELQWTNPHIWVQVTVPDPATGKEVEWSIEGGSPNNLSPAAGRAAR